MNILIPDRLQIQSKLYIVFTSTITLRESMYVGWNDTDTNLIYRGVSGLF